jgi:choline dehydrogenase-like flavoprotein
MRLSGPYHGTTGTLKVSDTRYRHPLSLAFVRGAQDCGLPYNDDFNGARQEGIGFYHTTTFDGRRGSTAATYLKEVQGRHNLEVRTGSSVTRVVITNGRATGVEWRAANGETGIAHAREEVILASGALATPKILMLSGIGPGEHLRAHGIEVVANSAQVGQNYQDHLEVPVYGKAKEPCSLLGNDQGIRALKHGMQWAMYRTGLLTSNVVECGGFVDTSGQGCADIQFHVVPTLVGDVERQPLDGHGISISPCILRPSSRGSVMLRSRDPNDPILFDSGALAQESDVATLVRGVQLGRSIMRSPSMASVISEELLPSPAADMEEQAVAAYVRQYAKTVYHPAGTCRMGGPDAVLAPDLRVRGVTGLRVCDASAMPSIVSGNTNAPTIMIAERCADFALQSNRT